VFGTSGYATIAEVPHGFLSRTWLGLMFNQIWPEHSTFKDGHVGEGRGWDDVVIPLSPSLSHFRGRTLSGFFCDRFRRHMLEYWAKGERQMVVEFADMARISSLSVQHNLQRTPSEEC
jgi:hypothetical protein